MADPQVQPHWTAQALGEAGCSSAAPADAHADAWAQYYKALGAQQQQAAGQTAQQQQYMQYQQQQAAYQQQAQAQAQQRQQAWAAYYAQQQTQATQQQQSAYSGAYNYGQQGGARGGERDVRRR